MTGSVDERRRRGSDPAADALCEAHLREEGLRLALDAANKRIAELEAPRVSDPLKPELREQIARIISGLDLRGCDMARLGPVTRSRWEDALSKADSIAALFEAERGRLVEALELAVAHIEGLVEWPASEDIQKAYDRTVWQEGYDVATNDAAEEAAKVLPGLRSALAAVGEGFSSSRDHERSAGSPLEGEAP